MSYMQRKSNDAYAINLFLKRRGFDVSGKGRKQNKIMVEFLKSKGLPYKKWNNNYKGLNTADLINAETVQQHFQDFRNWIENYVD